jgi:hypothetical protein
MFSCFDGGITDTKCSKFIGFNELVHIIRKNPDAHKIENIRALRKKDDKNYKTLKSKLPYITPNCMIRVRNLEGDKFDQNFIQFSQFLYFDIDIPNPEEYKTNFIERYGHQAALICISSSGGGISVLFRVKNIITKENFTEIWDTVHRTIFPDENIDMKCRDIGRAMFISCDPAAFYSYDNEIEVNLENTINVSDKKREKQSKPCKDFNNNLISPFSIIPLNIVLQELVTHTMVQVVNPIVDYKPAEYVEFFIPKIIKDGTKHDIYTSMIHTLCYLNPSIKKEYIFSYLLYINNRFARPKMEKREFVRLYNLVYDGIKETGKAIVRKEIKYVHFNPEANLTKEDKIIISNMLNGFKRKNESIQKIIDARLELEQMGRKITQRSIAEFSGLSPKTIRTHQRSTLTDMDEVVKMVNNSVPIKTIPDILGYNYHNKLVVQHDETRT